MRCILLLLSPGPRGRGLQVLHGLVHEGGDEGDLRQVREPRRPGPETGFARVRKESLTRVQLKPLCCDALPFSQSCICVFPF